MLFNISRANRSVDDEDLTSLEDLVEAVEKLQIELCGAIEDGLLGRTMPRLEAFRGRRRGSHPERIIVFVKLSIHRLDRLDTKAQTFGADLSFRLWWKVPPGETLPSPEEDDGDWRPKWKPKYVINNMVLERGRFATFTLQYVQDVLHIVAVIRHIVEIHEDLELRDFPIDTQNFTISFQSELTVEDVWWVPGRGEEIVDMDATAMEMDTMVVIKEHPLTHALFIVDNEDRQFCCLEASVKAMRKGTFYLLNVAFILFMLGTLVLCAWAAHPAEIGERLNVDFMLILTVVTFKLYLNTLLPPLSYPTMLDIYVLTCVLFLCLLTICHTFLPIIDFEVSDRSPLTYPPLTLSAEEKLLDQDAGAFRGCAGLWIAINVFFVVAYYCRSKSIHKEAVIRSQRRQRVFGQMTRALTAGDLDGASRLSKTLSEF